MIAPAQTEGHESLAHLDLEKEIVGLKHQMNAVIRFGPNALPAGGMHLLQKQVLSPSSAVPKTCQMTLDCSDWG